MTAVRTQRLHLISNSKSGRGAGGSLSDIAERVTLANGFELIHHQIENPEDLDKKAIEAVNAAELDGGIVAAAGGDGTVRSVAQHLVGKDIRFAVIPCGTFNLFARNHQVPEDLEAALQLALVGTPTKVRLGKVNEHIFVLNASLGLYAKVIQDRQDRIDRWGRNRIVALISTFVSLLQGHRLLDVDLEVDGQVSKAKTPMIFIGNNALQLRTLALKIADCMKQDHLATVLMKPLTRWMMIRLLFRGISKSLENEQNLETFCVDSLTIYSKKKTHKVALDGEMFHLPPPYAIQALPSSLLLMKP